MPDTSLDDLGRSNELVLSSMIENAAVLALSVDPFAALTGRVKKLAAAATQTRNAGDTASPQRIGVRILVADEAACYRVMFVVHQRFAHDAEAYRDYIRAPKANGYRAIHTTVFDDEQRPVELRVRARAAHGPGRRRSAAPGEDAPRGTSTRALASPGVLAGPPVPSSIQRAIMEMAAARASGDRVIGRLVASALLGAGRDGSVLIEEEVGATLHTLEFSPGLRLARARSRITGHVASSRMRLHDAIVLVMTGLVLDTVDWLPLLELASVARRPLVVVAEGAEGGVLPSSFEALARAGLDVCVVVAPGGPARRRKALEDVAELCDTQVFASESGFGLARVTLGRLGRARSVTVADETITLVGKRWTRAETTPPVGSEGQEPQVMDDHTLALPRLPTQLQRMAVLRVAVAGEAEAAPARARVQAALRAACAAAEEMGADHVAWRRVVLPAAG